MTDAFEHLVDRATARLAGDAELRLEVRRELLTHLRAAAADHAAAGDADPTTGAIASLGEPEVLADRLWQTHRRRIRRRQIARLLTATFAWPAGVAVLAILLISLARSAAPVATFVLGRDAASKLPWWPVALLAGVTPADRVAALPADRRVLLGEAYDLNPDFLAGREAAKAAVAALPGDRAAYAAYVAREVGFLSYSTGPNDPKPAPGKIAAVLAVLDRGAAIDPDNALYPLWMAQALAVASSVQLRDQPADYFPYASRFWSNTQPCWKLRVDDPAMFEQAVAQLRRAVSMPRLDDYADAFAARRLAAMPEAHDLGAQAMRAAQQWSTLKPAATCYDLNFTMAARALDLAVAGHTAEAQRLMADVRAAEAMTIAAADRVGVAVFPLGFDEPISAHAAAVLQVAGHAADAERLRTWTDAQTAAFLDAYPPDRRQAPRPTNVGLLEGHIAQLTRKVQPAGGALARAEYTLADRAAVAGLMTVLLAAAAASVIATGVGAIGGHGRPTLLLLPGPRESAVLLAAALGLPVAGYAMYVFGTATGNRVSGLGSRETALFYEYLILTAVIVMAAVLVARRGVVRRLHAVLPPRKIVAGFNRRAAAVAWRCLGRPGLVLVAGYGVALGVDRVSPASTAVVICVLLSACAAATTWGGVEVFRDARRRRIANPAAGRRQSVLLAGVMLTAVALVAAAWASGSKDWAAVAVMCGLLPMVAMAGVVAVVLAYLDDADRLAAEQGVRVVGTVLRSVAVRLVMVAVVAGVVGGLGLRWAEARAVRQAERADGLVVNPPIASDAKVAALRDFTIAGLHQQRQTFDRLAAGGR